MNTALIPFAALWALLALGVLALFLWRKTVSAQEDDQIHMADATPTTQQTVVAAKLDQIDKWGKTLTVVTVVFGLLLLVIYVYLGWVNGGKIVE